MAWLFALRSRLLGHLWARWLWRAQVAHKVLASTVSASNDARTYCMWPCAKGYVRLCEELGPGDYRPRKERFSEIRLARVLKLVSVLILILVLAPVLVLVLRLVLVLVRLLVLGLVLVPVPVLVLVSMMEDVRGQVIVPTRAPCRQPLARPCSCLGPSG